MGHLFIKILANHPSWRCRLCAARRFRDFLRDATKYSRVMTLAYTEGARDCVRFRIVSIATAVCSESKRRSSLQQCANFVRLRGLD